MLRTAFLRDVDAIGTLTERASGWSFFFGLLLLATAGAGVYLSTARAQYAESLSRLPGVGRVDAVTGFYRDGRQVAPALPVSLRFAAPGQRNVSRSEPIGWSRR